jgi:hypothetical protein
MTRYADPTRCPDCGATITPGTPVCGACALPLVGQTAQQLFVTLSQADDLLTVLRAAPASPTRAVAASGAASPLPVPVRRRRGLSSATVPQILLALGAGCLLVAALVFLAVSWSVMGVGGRTATLGGLTVVAGCLAAWMSRRALRGAAESLALVGYGLLTLDVLGADHAGWFGHLSTAGLTVLVGAVLTVSGVAGAVGARRAATRALTVGEVVAVIGSAALAAGLSMAEWLPAAPSLVVATLAAATVAAASLGFRLRVAAAGSAVVTGFAWLALTGMALDRALAQPTWTALWRDLVVWPLLVAAVLVGAPALVSRLSMPVRVSAASVAGLLVVVAATAPVLRLSPTTMTLAGLGVLVAAGVVSRVLPRRWALVPAGTQAVAGVAVLCAALLQAALAAARLVEGTEDPWAGTLGDRLPVTAAGVPAAWLLPLVVFVLLATTAVLAEASTLVDRAVGSVPGLQVLPVALLAAAVAGCLALYPVALWLVVGVLLLLGGAFTAWSLSGRTVAPLVPAGTFGSFALVVSLHAAGLTAAALGVTLALTGAVHLSSRSVTLAAGVGAVFSASVAGSVWTIGHLLGADAPWVSATGLVVLGALVLLAPYAPGRWWAADAPALCRTGLEVGAAAAALPLASAGVLLAEPSSVATWAAVHLTVVGVVVTLMSLLREDRRVLGWAGGALLALASWVRLADLGVTGPEAYTLPSAAALLVVGIRQLQGRPEVGTLTALTPGLSLALVPSLLRVLDEPTGPRALLLGLACLALVLVGSRLGWTAPVVLGATVGALVVLRLAAPYLGDAVPRWVLIGGAGALLIGIGATWERRLTEARHLMGYVRALR